MTTFDGSTRHTDWTPPSEPDPMDGNVMPIDTLDLLREQIAAQEAESDRPTSTIVDVPGGAIRLVCTNDIPSKQISRWNSKALPVKRRKATQVSPLEIDQNVLNSSILIDTCQHIEVLRDGQWVPITDTDGEFLGFRDQPLLRVFGAVDPAAAIKKLFPRDADLIHAGQDVLRGAGWGDEDGDDVEDPS